MRKRLTARNVRAESQADGLFPGDIGNEERAKNYHDPNEYSNYELQEGWDIPEKDAEPIKDERDEVGFGISKTASKFRLAKHASVLAQLCLGDDCPDEVLEDQARDFMKMGDEAIVASIRRWKATEPAPAPAEETQEVEADDETEVKGEEGDQVTDENADGTAEEGDEVADDAAGDAEVNADEEGDDEEGEDDVDDLATEDGETDIDMTADEDEDAPEMEIEIPEVAEDNADQMFSNENELTQAEADPELVALFNGEEVAEEAPVTASKKASKKGIKRLAGQPRLASAEGLKELEGLWDNLSLPRL